MSIQSNSAGSWASDQNGFSPSSPRLWSYDITNSGYYRNNTVPTRNASLIYRNTYITYNTNKNYIFKTLISGLSTNNYIDFQTPWNTTDFASFYFTHSHTNGTYPGVTGGNSYSEWSTSPYNTQLNEQITLIYSEKPTSQINTNTRVKYKSIYHSAPFYIKGVDVVETDWNLQGYSWATSSVPGNDERYIGWRYANGLLEYNFTNKTGKRNAAPFYKGLKSVTVSGAISGIGGKAISYIDYLPQTYAYTNNNYASKYISVDQFNIQFEFSTNDTTNGFVKLYVLPTLPSSFMGAVNFNNKNNTNAESFSTSLRKGQYLGQINEPGVYNFYNVTGNGYLVFVSNYPTTISPNSSFRLGISNVKISGGYSKIDNNEKFQLDPSFNILGSDQNSKFSLNTTTDRTLHEISTSNVFGVTGGTGSIYGFYSDLYGTVTNIAQLNSKIGNGTFKAGIWENGVWNNGWRDDEEVYDFYEVENSISFSSTNNKWRVQIFGSTQSASKFKEGDKVSVGNIVSIDINQKRSLLKSYYTIVSVDDNNIVIEVLTPFPIMRIEKDSEEHNIMVTKNIWLNGAFLNGYFQGIWNDGLFKGYPIITEMYNSQWIDGTFDGGHFYSTQNKKTFLDTWFYKGNVGLTFGATAHGFKVGDTIEIDKFDKTVNPNYDGKAKVIEIIDDYYLITDLPWGANSSNESGFAKTPSTGLIQHFKFKDNNVAKKTANESKNLLDIWKYNSWIDVNYSDQSSTNIGRDRIFYNQSTNDLNTFFDKYKLGIGDYSPLNLYGFITNDVLSSESSFRNIDSIVKKNYSLGVKYEIYEDYIGDASNFNSPFGTTDSYGGLTNFYNDGWTYSYSGSRLKYEREVEVGGDIYLDNFLFFDNIYKFYPSIGQNRLGFIGTASNLNSDFVVGEEINISQFPGYTHVEYNGKSKVYDFYTLNPGSNPYGAFTASVVIIEKEFLGNTPAEGGYIHYQKNKPASFTFSRTIEGTFRLEHNDNSIQSFVLNNTNITIPKNRYSVIEFDYLEGPENYVYFNSSNNYDFHFIDLFNFTTFPEQNGLDLIYGATHAFPNPPTSNNSGTYAVWASGINYKTTKNTKKVEYFYNRKSLDLGLLSLSYYNIYGWTQSYVFEIDNIKFYEVDMIPFFQYTTSEYVNKSVQVPLQGVAPKIDYTDANFSFVTNIQMGIDSVIINKSNATIQTQQTAPGLIFTNQQNSTTI